MNRALQVAACLMLAACQTAPGGTTGVPIATPIVTAAISAQPTAATPPASPGALETDMPSAQPTTTGPFNVTSTAFEAGGSIPSRYTCDGKDTSPQLAWTGAPAGTKALALIMDDPDAGGFVHWVVFNLAASVSDLTFAILASQDGVPQGLNSFGRVGYGGPCPPSGTHHYVFRLLALDASLPLSGTPTAKQVLAAADGHVLAEARLTGTYRKGG